MLSKIIQNSNLFYCLYLIDCDFAEQQRSQNCIYCGGPLHISNYQRKPRGGPNVPDEYMTRHSLCCSREGCRKRHLPPSCRFLGRKVYWSAVILMVMAFRQIRPNGPSINLLKKKFGVPYKTISRWIKYFQEVFPLSAQWKRLRGRIVSSVNNNELPGQLFWYFIRNSESQEAGLVGCLKFLATGLIGT